jgi:hypothetical protein
MEVADALVVFARAAQKGEQDQTLCLSQSLNLSPIFE